MNPANDPTRYDVSSFVGHVTNLGYQGQIFLGVVPHPQSGESVEPNLPAVEVLIGTLEMLQQKTEGNRTREESDYLMRILTDLRLRYVEAKDAAKQ